MPNTMNRAFLSGIVQADPDIVILPRGKQKVARFDLLTPEEWRDRDGNRATGGEHHKIVVYNDKICEFVERYVRRGSQVLVEGQIKTRRYVDAREIQRSVTEIVLGTNNRCTLELTSTKSMRDAEAARMDLRPDAALAQSPWPEDEP